jgi:tetratricopeptide (TPR) repeat protein
MKTVRIFISSPGDVAEERERARQVVEGLRRRYAGQFHLLPVLWEDLPLQADMSFQQGIDLVLSQEHGIDVAVLILWSRLGSPLGVSIRKQDGTEYRSGTERELDLMLTARRQSGGDRPALLVYTRRDDTSFDERLRGRLVQEQREMVAQKELVLQFIEEEFHDGGSGHNVRAYHSFDRPTSLSQRLRAHLTGLLDELAGEGTATAVWDIEHQGAPFLGLEAFQPRHADVFFGREEETLEARQALREQARNGHAFLLLSGASGSGKSSLARAGVLPAIMENELDEQVAEWRTVIATPLELGGDPLGGIVRRLAADDMLSELRGEADGLEDLIEGLRRDPALTIRLRVKDAFARAAKKRGGGVRVLLLLDQLEELFASTAVSSAARTEFLTGIEALAGSGHVWVLATLRADFWPQAQTHPVLVRLTSGHGLLPVLPPETDALRRLIEEPARLAGLVYEQRGDQSLADRILRDAADHAELLPLLEYVLRELFEQRTAQRVLTWESYEKLGGVMGALATRAEDTFKSLPVKAQDALGGLLKSLVTLGRGDDEGGGEQIVRQRVPQAVLTADPASAKLVQALVAERLLTSTSDPASGEAIITVVHESLLRVWPRAVAWITQNREFLRRRARLQEARRAWSAAGKHADYLLHGLPLAEAEELLSKHDLDAEDAEFVRVSGKASRAEIQRRLRLRNTVIAALSVLTLIAAGIGVMAMSERTRARGAKSVTVTTLNRMVDQLVPAVADINTDAEGKQRSESIRLLEQAVESFPASEKDAEVERLEAIVLSMRAAHNLWEADVQNDPVLAARPEIQAVMKSLSEEINKPPAERSWDRINELSRESMAAYRAASPPLQAATEKSNQALALFEKLLPQFPTDANLRFRQGIASKMHSKYLTDDEPQLLKHYQTAITTFAKVAELDPARGAECQAMIARCHDDVATLYLNCKYADKAEPYLKLAGASMERLAAAEPQSPRWLEVVAGWHTMRAMRLELLRSDAEALVHRQRALELRRAILKLSDNNDSHLALGLDLVSIASTQNLSLRQFDPAIATGREAVSHLAHVLRSDPAHKKTLRAMVRALDGLSSAYRQKGGQVPATDWAAAQALEYQRRLVATDPLNLDALHGLYQGGFTLWLRSVMSKEPGEKEKAAQMWQELLEMAEKGLWLSRDTVIHPRLVPEESPGLWRRLAASTAQGLRPPQNPDPVAAELQARWADYDAAFKETDAESMQALEGKDGSPAFFKLARTAHDLAVVLNKQPAAAATPPSAEQRTLVRVLLDVSRSVLARPGRKETLNAEDQRRLESIDTLLHQLPAPEYQQPLLEHLDAVVRR